MTSQGIGTGRWSRGALGHWIEIKDKKIANYQCVVPRRPWNMSPRDTTGNPVRLKQALIGTKIKDEKNPFELGRIIRSMDPCLACAIHLITPNGEDIGTFSGLLKKNGQHHLATAAESRMAVGSAFGNLLLTQMKA